MFKRKTKMPEIFLAKYFVEPKSAGQVSKISDSLYAAVRVELNKIAVVAFPVVSHNNGHSIGGEHGCCKLDEYLEHRAQHPSACADHTMNYLLPNDVGVRVNPIVLSVQRGTKSVKTGDSCWDWHLENSYANEICVEVIVRSTKKKQQKDLENLLNSVGVIREKVTPESGFIYLSY